MGYQQRTVNAPPSAAALGANHHVETHPLTAPMFHNSTRSPLAGLPDAILLRIMGHVDDVSLFCLRRTCRTMLRLFSNRQFWHLQDHRSTSRWSHNKNVKEYQRNPNWPRQREPPWKRELLTDKAKILLRPLLQKDMYCAMCRNISPDVERRLQTEFLYCSGCREHHPAGLFSIHERRGLDVSRLCIGREGYIRICEHRTVSWTDVESFFRSGQEDRQMSCYHPSHGELCGGDGLSAGIHVFLVRRKHESIYRSCCGRRRNVRPMLAVGWEPHFHMHNLGKSNKLDFDDLLARVRWARRNGGSFILDATPGKVPAEMQTFDPNFCSCCRIPTLDATTWEWAIQNQDEPSPRCSLHASPPPHGSEQYGFVSTTKLKDFTPFWWNSICLSHHYSSTTCFVRCPHSPGCLAMRYNKSIPLDLGPCESAYWRPWGKRPSNPTQPWSAAWFMALDPDSYGLRDDAESRGVYWCDNESCLNHHRFHAQNPQRRALDMCQRRQGAEAGAAKPSLRSRFKSWVRGSRE